MKDSEKLIQHTLETFKNRVNTTISERQHWESTVYKSANDSLYALLVKVFELYEGTKGNSKADSLKRKWLMEQCQSKNLRIGKNLNFIQLITKLVFSDAGVDSKRVSSYSRVLIAASQSPDVQVADDIPDFIRKYGGIEEVRASLTKSSKTPGQRAEAGKALLQEATTIASVTCDELKAKATISKNHAVCLLGIMSASGELEIKHVVYDSESASDTVGSTTVINGALANLYSNHRKRTKEAEDKNNAEKAAADKASALVNIGDVKSKHEANVKTHTAA
ncbi:hypothetical protein [Halomonas sp. GFAJ-1]|uniref:hypothetical protein n=1 Tax=Halomonas sp. GFAJ-1 TaxID=1118153 RepID=UPI00023A3CDC|nr:hypothetical protein [Halomonas sp. GFAJ-1]AVI62511.1 hypothetical protein BB497_07260 [Halomonas sp. GFAJ-1]EHK62048.1 hypothetical protein MOY_03178 [Halomonas sp. GFAJ-1]